MVYPEVLGIPVRLNPFLREEKAGWTQYIRNFTAAVDSSGMCLFIARALGPADFAGIISAVTNAGMSEKEFLTAGERIWNLQKVFNIRAGLGKDDDTLPERLMETSLSSDAPAGEVWRRDPSSHSITKKGDGTSKGSRRMRHSEDWKLNEVREIQIWIQ